jgi:hypothetical protein
MPIKIGAGWLPDLSPAEIGALGGLQIAKNLIPIDGGYRPMNSLYQWGSATIDYTPLAAIAFGASDGIWRNFVGTTVKLYRVANDSATDISDATYNCTSWRFQNYGDWLIATNGIDNIKVLKNPNGSVVSNLGGSPPKAKYMLLRRGHLILANTNEDGTGYPKRIRWSARENPEDWTPSLTTGADYQDFPEMLGDITGLGAIGDDFVIFSHDSLTIAEYSSVYVFAFRVNAYAGVGCRYPNSIISIGPAVFFWGRNAIYQLQQDGTIKDISTSRVKKAVVENVNDTYAHRISAAHDYANRLIMWAYPSSTSDGEPDKILVYNYQEDKFTLLDISVSLLGNLTPHGDTYLDDLTTTSIDEASTIIDLLNVDTGLVLPMAVSGSTQFNFYQFTGVSMSSELKTGEYNIYPKVGMARKVFVPAEGLVSGTVSIHHRYSPMDAYSITPDVDIKSDGSADVRCSDRFMALHCDLDDFTKLSGSLYCDMAAEGER